MNQSEINKEFFKKLIERYLEATLLGLRGRVVKTQNLTNMGDTINLDLSYLDSATYFLVVKGRKGSKQFKLVVK